MYLAEELCSVVGEEVLLCAEQSSCDESLQCKRRPTESRDYLPLPTLFFFWR